ncbi:uncharacterized protein FMAN_14287 [Fusarium mangiferae]|uniref:DUF6570 domain-containing protein n=1 Tax=Fusarium mangiferae TaxID=192010 RepID=A0A1L7UED1_FUSMA|nr:uncharacterized protein FMAN_14287 [Fusarium mangiferae]CVL09014.1 uncharacterized protein FMAN_14287 [Fusarium mangiferae]
MLSSLVQYRPLQWYLSFLPLSGYYSFRSWHVQPAQGRGAIFLDGHVISLLKNIGQVYRQPALLPQNLDFVILRPQNQSAQPPMIHQWLEFLRTNHPGYRDIVVDEGHSSQLPVDGDVTDQLVTEFMDPAEIEEFIQDDTR